jgi:dihydroxyacetone kinase phosphotransfer subunit
MVGIVIVSHSEKIAQGVVELCKQMASEVPMVAAGGLPGGEIGTDFGRIYEAVESVMSDDGVAVLFDLGSALMTTEMVMEQFEPGKIMLADAPIVEGAVIAAVSASMGLSLEQVVAEARTAAETPKIQ